MEIEVKFEIVLFPERVRVPLSGILTPRVSDWGYAGRKIGFRQRLESSDGAPSANSPSA